MNRSLLLGLMSATMLTACGGGSANLAGTDTASTVSNVPAMATSSAPLQLSGSPTASVRVGDSYSFKPAVTAGNSKALVFSLQNRPSWIRFDAATGAMNGTPGSGDLGNYSGLVLSVSDGTSKLSLPTFSITVQARSQGQLGMGGVASPSVAAGDPYEFQPTVSNPFGKLLAFSIRNKPDWAKFDAATGLLSGTPTAANIGTTSGIVITVSDGSASVSTSPFSLTVTPYGAATATLSWTAPAQNTDGSRLMNLAGYRIFYGRSLAQLSKIIEIRNPGIVTYVLSDLSPGTWYFAVKTFTSANVESDFSGTVKANL